MPLDWKGECPIICPPTYPLHPFCESPELGSGAA